MKILEVDDNIDLANCIAQLLEAENHDTTVAYTGEEALEHIDSYNYDLILLDAKLPDYTGFQLLGSIYSKNPQQKVIMITGYRIDQLLTQAAPGDEHAIITHSISLDNITSNVTEQSSSRLIMMPVDHDIKVESLLAQIQPATEHIRQIHTFDDIPSISQNETVFYYADKPLIYAIFLLAELRKNFDNQVIIAFPHNAGKAVNYKEYSYTGCIFKPFDPEYLLDLIASQHS